MDTFSSFQFLLDNTYPPKFPRTLNLDDDDPLSFQTYHESYTNAQDARVPYYAVVVVESSRPLQQDNNPSIETFYQTYDMSGYLANAASNLKQSTCPVSGQAIKKIHLFVVRCFEADPAQLFKPINPTIKQMKLQPVPTPSNPVTHRLFQDALNIIESPTADQLERMRQTQSQLIRLKISHALFPDLKGNARNEETRLWLWCNPIASHEGVVRLFEACVNEPTLALSAAIYTDPLRLTSQLEPEKLTLLTEREAVLKAKVLVKQYAL